jgi:zinc D-Ala-D-Ala carboxypeptidase
MSYTQAQAGAVCRAKFAMRGSDAQVVSAFQKAYNLGTWLGVDGKCGPATSAAIAKAVASGNRPSANFTFAEFRCRCGGTYQGCRGCLVMRELLQSLERYRAKVGATTVVSGYRCPVHNKRVGSKPGSQHILGAAADLASPWTYQQVAALHLFGGLGYSQSSKRVKHADRRDVSGHNNGGSLARPMSWVYAS